MNKLIIANWKMNVLPSESVKFISDIEKIDTQNKIIILAPYIDLPYLRSNSIEFGSQNVHHKDKGSYTGEISIDMLKDININCCLIGHMERRKLFNEKDSLIQLKVRNALNHGLKVILCVSSIKELSIDISGTGHYENLVVAYEPEDYIGGNMVAPIEKIKEFVRDARIITDNKSKIVYGGGVNVNNIDIIKNIEELDGIIVGNSSLKVENFKEIIERY